MLGVEPDYLPCFNGLVSVEFGPQTPTRGGFRGDSPPSRGSLETPQKGFFLEKFLVKYCNFVVNLDRSLCHGSDDRSYVNLRVFFPRRKPSIIYEGIVLRLCIILRDETVRK